MATYYANEIPQRLLPAGVVDGSVYQGRLKVLRRNYTMLGTEVAAEKVYLGKLKKGSIILTAKSTCFVLVDPGATLTLDVGDDDASAASYRSHTASDADRYCDGANIASVGAVAFASGVAATDPHILQSDANIIATFATLSTPAAGGLLHFEIVYQEGS